MLPRRLTRVLLSVAVVGLFSSTSCGWATLSHENDECSLGASECFHGQARACVLHTDAAIENNVWQTSACGGDRGQCAVVEGKAICVLSNVPDPRCAEHSFCDGKKLVTCEGPYPASASTCNVACRQGGTAGCEHEGAFCTTSDAPEPRCAGKERACKGDRLLYCTCGYPVEDQSCGSPGTCLDAAACGDDTSCRSCIGDGAACAMGKDARCPSAQVGTTACADDTVMSCACGFRTFGFDTQCTGSTPRCVVHEEPGAGSSYASCAP